MIERGRAKGERMLGKEDFKELGVWQRCKELTVHIGLTDRMAYKLVSSTL
jgi:hypothetical protein